ncbi:MAG: bifunctional adenosylcobinamide kinase/adenosylcobinamide-phosphate guanylyltransferase [Oscillospiraceae bacterium]|nr:bifunctional adenosylcobinamide kinase/adenosylcobinamide-phosphate guanylyltransferase [Oscillospiraceae bacterium]
MILITGGCKSGRSKHAETLLSGYSGRKIYIATMINDCAEAEQTIERHIKQREGKGFETIERTHDIHNIHLPEHCAVLVEDAVNLLANEMFGENVCDPVTKTAYTLKRLDESCDMLIVVTSSTGSDGQRLGKLTDRYTAYLGMLNSRLAKMSDTVIESVCGIPVTIKERK